VPTKRKALVARRSAEDLRQSLDLFDNLAYLAVGTSDFAEAKRLITRHEPDLVVADVRFGAFNGVQLVLWNLLRNPQSRGILIDASRDRLLEADAARYGSIYVTDPPLDALRGAIERSFADTPRQSVRSELPRPYAVDVGGNSAMMVNVSYGGLCLHGDDLLLSSTAATPFQLTVPNVTLSVMARRIWSQQTPAPGGREASCGAAVLEQSRGSWRAFVDQVVTT
jgi:hypothetical protein